MIKIGITGGIGSGKTTVCKIFEQFGVPVFYADDEAKKLLQKKEIIHLLEPAFGNAIIDSNGNIDRTKLATLVFNDEVQLKKLNAIIHPEVAKIFENWLQKNKGQQYIVKEAAILFESGASKALDKNISVSAPLELRISRVMRRDNVAREKVLDRMKNQFSDEERGALADHVIINDDKQALLPQALELHEKFRGVK